MILLKKFLKKDIFFIYSLQSLRNRKYFLNNNLFTFNSHLNWLKIKNKLIYIVYNKKNVRVGYVKIEFINQNKIDISIIIKEIYRKKNFASFVIRKIEKKFINKTIRAVIHKKNIASLNLFKKYFYNKKKTSNNFVFLEKLIKF